MNITLGAELVSMRLGAGHRCAPEKQSVLRVGAFFIELKITKGGMAAPLLAAPCGATGCVCLCGCLDVWGHEALSGADGYAQNSETIGASPCTWCSGNRPSRLFGVDARLLGDGREGEALRVRHVAIGSKAPGLSPDEAL